MGMDESWSQQHTPVHSNMSVLGFLDEELTVKSKAHHTSTYLGGEPLFPPTCSPPDHTTLSCNECQAPLQLALQAYSPVVEQQERTLYLFFCGSCAAPESWKCLRTIQLIQPKNPNPRKKKSTQGNSQNKPPSSASPFLFSSETTSSSGNPFETDSWDVNSSWDEPAKSESNDTTTNDLEELLRLRDLSLQEKNTPGGAGKKKKKKQRKPASSNVSPAVTSSSTNAGEEIAQTNPTESVPPTEEDDDRFRSPAMWIYVEEEPEDDNKPADNSSERPLSSIDGADASETAQWSGEKYERNTAYTKNFSRFLKHTQRAPEQILRYCLGGDALWVTNRDMPTIPPCDVCGAERTFELQLMPHGLNWIGANLVTGETWNPTLRLAGCGSVFVFSCSAFCEGDKLREELVVTQETEDNSLDSRSTPAKPAPTEKQ